MDNEKIKNKVRGMLTDIVDEIDPDNMLDSLIARRIVNIADGEKIINKQTKKERCRALIYHLLECSHKEAFIVFMKALKKNYSWIAERINTDDENKDDFNASKFSIQLFINQLKREYFVLAGHIITVVDGKEDSIFKS